MSFTLHGIGASSGIAIGRAHLASPSRVEVAHYVLPESQIDSELERFTAAVEQTREELRTLRTQIPPHAPAELPAFLDMHLLILDDNMIDEEPKRLIREQRCNAEWALTQQMEALVARFDEIEDAYLRSRQEDVVQVVQRVIKTAARGSGGCRGQAKPFPQAGPRRAFREPAGQCRAWADGRDARPGKPGDSLAMPLPPRSVARAAVRSVSNIGRYLRWFSLFTRYRFALVDELARMHARAGGAALICPALIDYSKWLDQEVDESPLAQQIELMGLIATRRNGPAVHGFAPFDPLREAYHRRGLEQSDPVGLVRGALTRRAMPGMPLVSDYTPWLGSRHSAPVLSRLESYRSLNNPVRNPHITQGHLGHRDAPF